MVSVPCGYGKKSRGDPGSTIILFLGKTWPVQTANRKKPELGQFVFGRDASHDSTFSQAGTWQQIIAYPSNYVSVLYNSGVRRALEMRKSTKHLY